MFLLDSGQFASDPDGLAQNVTDMLEKAGGTLVAQRPWQDGRLAYEIAGRRKGLHYLAYFRLEPDKITGLNRSCRLNDRILRHMFIQQPPTLFDAMVSALTGEAQPEVEDAPEPAVAEVPVIMDDES
jgi:small subunit ribosomal protein S6